MKNFRLISALCYIAAMVCGVFTQNVPLTLLAGFLYLGNRIDAIGSEEDENDFI